MSRSSGFVQSRLNPTVRVAAWLFVGFLGIVGLGFLLHAFWLSAAVAGVLAVLGAPPAGRWLRAHFASAAAGVAVRTLALFAGVALLIVASEYERAQRRAEYDANRDEILTSARQALEQGQDDRLTDLVTRYEFVETPRLERLEAALVKQQAKEASRPSENGQLSRKEKKIDEMVDQVMEEYRKESQ